MKDITTSTASNKGKSRRYWIPEFSPLPGELLAYGKFPAALLLDHRLDGSHVKVLLALALHTFDGRCRPTQSRLAEILGWHTSGTPHRRRVNAALHGVYPKGSGADAPRNGLIAWGWVSIVLRGFKRAAEYQLKTPEVAPLRLTRRIKGREEHEAAQLTAAIESADGFTMPDATTGGTWLIFRSDLADDLRQVAKGDLPLIPLAAYEHYNVRYPSLETSK